MTPRHDEKERTGNLCNFHPCPVNQPTPPDHQHRQCDGTKHEPPSIIECSRSEGEHLLLDFREDFGVAEEMVFFFANLD